jgi:glycosyltransferase involved in cell wall biosynthesis
MHKAKPLVSIVVTTHYRPNLLVRALQSLLLQNFLDFEIILCSDESSELTKQVANSLLRQQDSFISVPQIKGPAGTRNLGISVSSGKWICFLDDDDSLDNEFLSKATNLLTNTHQLHYFNFTEIIEKREEETTEIILSTPKDISNSFSDNLFIGNFIPNNAIFVPNDIAKNNHFDPRLQSHEDWDWLISLKDKGYEFIHHPVWGPNVHLHPGESRNVNLNSQYSKMLDFLSIYRKWPIDSDKVKELRSLQMEKFGFKLARELL